MSATNKTTFYDLPIFLGSDVPSWLTDFNGAMQKIDAAIKDVSDRISAINIPDAIVTADGNGVTATEYDKLKVNGGK